MSERYEEIFEGESIWRSAPDARHEEICHRLHDTLAASLAAIKTTRLLDPRSVVQLSAGTIVRPDLALVTLAGGKLWLVAEIVCSHDHHTDTVTKKTLYENLNVPRLWMVDPRYDNVEIYHGTPYGLALQHILAGRELLTESLLPELSLSIADLFRDA